MNQHRTTVFVCLVAAVGFFAHAQEGQNKLDSQSLQASETQLIQIVQDSLQAAGATPNTQALHLVFAFKTGFFKDDPMRAAAARQVATDLVQRFAVAGDRITARAFEFGLWEYKTPEASTITLTNSAENDPDKIKDVAQLWPLTPKAGSAGGHDLERAAVALDQNLGEPNDTVVVMLLNSAASQGAPGETLIGSNATEYQALLERWTRIPGTKDGATLEMPYKVTVPNGSATEAKLSAVVFVPKTFSGLSLGGSTRNELLINATAAPPTPTSTSGGLPLGLLLLPLLAGLGFFAYRTFAGNGVGAVWTLEVVDGVPSHFALRDTPNGRIVAVLAGNGYENSGGNPVSTIAKAPDKALGRFVRQGAGVRLESGEILELKEVNGDVVDGSHSFKLDPNEPEHSATFAGDMRSSTNVVRHTSVVVRFRLVKGEG